MIDFAARVLSKAQALEHLTLETFGNTPEEGTAILQGLQDSKITKLKEL